MSIGDLAQQSGLAASTIRYYEEVGVLGRPARVSGQRVFEQIDLNRLLVVSFAKEAGFSLREIRQLFDGFASDTPAGVRWKTLAAAKLAELEVVAARLEAMRRLLEEALRCGCIELETCGPLLRSPALHPSDRRVRSVGSTRRPPLRGPKPRR